jgi:DNA polymerase elongation subunit (family B)
MYVDILFEPHKEVLRVVERSDSGERIYKEFQPDYHFFLNDARGSHKSIYGNPVKMVKPRTFSEMRKMRSMYYSATTWESDIKQDCRCLETHYLGAESPKLQTAFFDIETDFDEVRGYSEPCDALNPITSIAVYLQWIEQMVCIAVPPPTLSWDEAQDIASSIPNVLLVQTEEEMLDTFLSLIEDADILSGWNSDFYDIPYTTNRIIKKLGKVHAKRMCLWDKLPESKMVERFGKEEQTYDLVGRIHLDYLKLYKNFNYEEKRSYNLNSIAEAELGERKVEYDGTLDQLYKNDFGLFLEYNIKDTKLLDDLDKKLQFIDLANDMAHDNCIKLPSILGAVGMTEQAIVLEAHSKDLKVPDKNIPDDDHDIRHKAAGGWVSHPKIGLHDWIGSSDLNSLYPSVIRALNMSNETIVGQIRTHETLKEIRDYIETFTSESKRKSAFAEWWNDRFCTLEMQYFFDDDKSHILYLDMEDGDTFELTGSQLRTLIFDESNNFSISANGTIYDNSKRGIIPSLLTRWYDERKTLKKIMNMYGQLEINEKNEYPIRIDEGLFTDADKAYDNYPSSNPYSLTEGFNTKTLQSYIEDNNKTEVVKYMNMHRLEVKDGVVVHSNQKELADIVKFWDKKQLVKKILLNSLYGGLLAKSHRFFDQRIGQSTTLTGRTITKHMTAKTNQILTGEYDHDGVTAVYNDTDSCIGSTLLRTSMGDMSIEDLFHACEEFEKDATTGKEYGYDEDIMVMSYCPKRDEPYFGHINYVYRHEVTKDLYEVEDSEGNKVTITEDHSIMVERDGELIEVKPYDLAVDDTLISVEVDK